MMEQNALTDEHEPLEAEDAEEVVDAEEGGEEAEAEDVSEQPEPQKAWSDDDEIEARAFGWKPSAEWNGPVPSGFIDDPRKYMERAQSFGPFRKVYEKLDQVEKLHQKQLERTKQEERQRYERQLETIRNGKRKAVEEADTDAYDRFDRAEKNLKPPDEAEPEQPDAPQHDLTPFQATKPWLNDPVLTSHGDQILRAAMNNGTLSPQASTQEQLDYAERELRSYFPQKFPQQKAKPKASPVEGGQQIAGTKKKSGFDSLPSEAKAEFRRMVQKGTFEDTEKDKAFYYDAFTNG